MAYTTVADIAGADRAIADLYGRIDAVLRALGKFDPAAYLGVAGKAADSDRLDGKDSVAFLEKAVGGDVAALTIAGKTPWHTGNLAVTPWQSSTPTMTGITLGDGTIAFYTKAVGDLLFFTVGITLGSTSAVTADLQIALPATSSKQMSYSAEIYDASPATRYHGRALITAGSANLAIRASTVSGTLIKDLIFAPTAPITWAAGDKIVTSGFIYAI
jgi:hypothetical protein